VSSGATPADAQSLIGEALGNYHITARLGSGTSSVYSAIDVALGREVALKVLLPALAAPPGAAERFRTEARRAAALTHPHIVPIYQIGEERGYLFIVMPLLAESLRERLARTQQFDVAEAVQLITQIAGALGTLHRQGMIHGAVRPDHVLFTDEGTPLLSILGLGRELLRLPTDLAPDDPEYALTLPRLVVASWHYLAPEQLLLHSAPDRRADVYALGAMLFELLVGVPPHEQSPRLDGFPQPIRPPSARNPQVSGALDQVILRALAYAPEERFADIESFLQALQQVVQLAPGAQSIPHSAGFNVEEIVSAPTVPTVALLSWPWRHDDASKGLPVRRRLVLIAVVCLLLLGGVAGGTTLLLNHPASASTTPVPLARPTDTPYLPPTPVATDTPRSSKPAITVSPDSVHAPDCTGLIAMPITLSTSSATVLTWTIRVSAGPPLAFDKTHGTVVRGKPAVIKVSGITTAGQLLITSAQAAPTELTVLVSCGL